MTVRILVGHVLDRLAELPDESVHCVCTSPPYYRLRDYGVPGQIGLEATPAEYIETMVAVFRVVRRVLRGDGTLWLNIGDSYAGGWGAQGRRVTESDEPNWHSSQIKNHPKWASHTGSIRQAGLKPKDLIGIPWALAFALRDDGWYLRSEITWAKRAPMPESVTDRPTSATEKVFLLTKSGSPTYWTHRDHAGSRTRPATDYRWICTEDGSETEIEPPLWRETKDDDGKPLWRRINLWDAHDYFYDAEAVKEPNAEPDGSGGWQSYARAWKTGWHARYPKKKINFARQDNTSLNDYQYGIGRNMRNVWLLGPEPFPEAHFAVFPTEIPRRAILAGTSANGVCPKCGAPWARMVSAKTETHRNKPISPRPSGRIGGDGWQENNRCGDVVSKTMGWRSTCSCDAGDPVPATILDCFLGAGTTALVADRLGRDCIGIELNESYAAMATRRLRADAGMFADISYGQFVAEAAAAE